MVKIINEFFGWYQPFPKSRVRWYYLILHMNRSLEKLKKQNKDSHELINTIVDVWLEEFHGTTYKEEEEKGIYYGVTTEIEDREGKKEFLPSFMVTKEQHDWWESKMKEILPKVLGVSKKRFERSWWLILLETSPMIKYR